MLVIVSKDASFKLDNSHFVVDGCYEDGYTYDRDIFFMEGLGNSEWCPVGKSSQYRPSYGAFVEVYSSTDNPVDKHNHIWDNLQVFEGAAYTVNAFNTGVDQWFEIYYGTEYLGDVGNDMQADGFVMDLNQAIFECLNVPE